MKVFFLIWKFFLNAVVDSFIGSNKFRSILRRAFILSRRILNLFGLAWFKMETAGRTYLTWRPADRCILLHDWYYCISFFRSFYRYCFARRLLVRLFVRLLSGLFLFVMLVPTPMHTRIHRSPVHNGYSWSRWLQYVFGGMRPSTKWYLINCIEMPNTFSLFTNATIVSHQFDRCAWKKSTKV